MTEDRLLRAIRAIVREVFPRYDFLGSYRYRVVSMVGDRAQLQAVRKDLGLPDLLPAEITPGLPGFTAELTQSSIVLVSFIEGDPKLPRITHFSRDGASTFVPVSLALDARDLVRIGELAAAVDLGTAAGAVLREGDQVSIAPGNGSGAVAGTLTITGPRSKVRA